MEIKIFKDYDEPYVKARAKLGAIRADAHTPLGDAYGKGLERIVSRPEPRRILWIITDGQPSFCVGDSRHSDYPLMATLKQKASRLGVETIGLGIGEKSMQPYVDRFVYIDGIDELPQTLMATLKGFIT